MKSWSRKFHIWLGLYFLVFLWLFSASGLLLNHTWGFADFWPTRRQTQTERPITRPAEGSDLQRALALQQQLGIAGELEWTNHQPTADRIEFRVQRPGCSVDVKADLAAGSAAVQEIRVNGWGIFRTLHTFNGIGYAQRPARDWTLTKLWTWSMDALAVGLIVLVATSVILAWHRRDRRRAALIAFAAGCLACGFFVFGLGWL